MTASPHSILQRVALVALALALLNGCAPKPMESGTLMPAPATVAWSRAQRVDVALDSFAYRPQQLRFVRGQAYRLHLRNVAGGGHNFHAPSFFRAVRLRDDATTKALAKAGGEIEVPGGGAVDVYFVTAGPGTFPLDCTHLLHASFGMTGEIVVK